MYKNGGKSYIPFGAIVGFTFLVTLCLQSILASIATNIGGASAGMLIFYLKFVVLIFASPALIITIRKYQVSQADYSVVGIFVLFTASMLLNSKSVASIFVQAKFFLPPVYIYCFGRLYSGLSNENLVQRFFYVAATLYVTVSLGFMLVGADGLENFRLKELLQHKASISGRANSITQEGTPINFFFYDGEGEKVPRAFGMMLDPLANAFFCVPIFFYFYCKCKEKMDSFKIITLLMVLFVCLFTLTRAIIIGIVFVCILDYFKVINRKGLFWVLCAVCLVFLGVTVKFFSNFSDILDPSTQAHLQVYQLALKDFHETGPVDQNSFIGNESLYLSILFNHGMAALIFFLFLVGKLFSCLQMARDKSATSDCLYLSLTVFLIASFTTEHWFAISSSGLFWYLLGATSGSNKFSGRKHLTAV